MRRRGANTTSSSSPSSSSSSSSKLILPSWSETRKHYIYILVLLSLCYLFVWSVTDRIPAPRKAAATPLHEFSEERARRFLTPLLDKIGYRVVGTQENDIVTTNYILDAIEDIQKSARCHQTSTCPDMEISVQHPNGSFVLKFMDFFITNKFTNLTNIALRVSNARADAAVRKSQSTHAHETQAQETPAHEPHAHAGAILINTHYDSALGGLGATDAGALVAVMMEMLRNILNSDESQFPLNYPLIFLFNGAEEALMMASHGFMSSHPWAKDIRMVLNMDSTGVGAAALFQQNSDRVLRAYASAAPHPHSTSFAVDLFKTEKFPGDTDFRIFRDCSEGRITGADFAYYRNGYMYHTLIDDDEHLRAGSVQHMGANLLATLRHILEHKVLDHPETTEISVFFDIFGKYMVLFTADQATVIAFSVIAFCIPLFFFNSLSRSFSFANVFKAIPAFLSIFAGILFAVIYAVLAGLLMLYFNPMSWYSNKSILIPLFYFPSFFGVIIGQHVFYRYSVKKYSSKDMAGKTHKILEAIKHDSANGVLLFQIIFTILTRNMGSLYYFVIPAFCMALGRFLDLSQIFSHTASKFLYFFCLLLPITFFIDAAYAIFELLVPVMGRAGPLVPSDIVVAVLAALGASLLTLPLLPLLHQRPAFRPLLKFFAVLIFVSLSLSISFMHAYTKDSPKRIVLQHASHAYPQEENFENKAQSFIAFAGLDKVPLHQDIFDDIYTYFNKDLYPETLKETDDSDWQELVPFDLLFRGIKLNSSPLIYNDGHEIKHPIIEVLSEQYDSVNNTRSLLLRMTYEGAEWSTLRFAGALVDWDVDAPVPPPHKGNNVIRHVGGYGVHSWESKVVLSGNAPIEFRVTGTHFKPTTLTNQITAFFPSWYTVMTVVTTISTYKI